MKKKTLLIVILSILVGFLAIPLASTSFVSAEEGKGRIWVADFGTESAKKDGKITFAVTGKKGWFSKTYSIELDVKDGWTPEKKAEELAKLLKEEFGNDLIVNRTGANVICQLKKDAKADDITKVEITENTTGEKGVRVYDDSYITYPEIVTFDIEGTPMDPAGVAILKIGLTYPLVSIDTYGKSPQTIKSELVYWFNDYYDGTGFVAKINYAGEVQIRDVPCKDGVTSGADDPALNWTLSMEDPPSVGGIAELPEIEEPRTVIPDLSDHNYGALAGIIVGAIIGTIALIGAAWYLRRRRRLS